MTALTAAKIVERLIADLTDRRGLRQTWEEIGPEDRLEIKRKWRKIIRETEVAEEKES